MTTSFKYLVVGRGLTGAAAARHLAMQSDGVAVIGPDEPTDRASHDGVFASHYDEGRITRTIDPDPVWARLANRSIARYSEIARESGIEFYTEAGCLVVGPKRGGADHYVESVADAATGLGVAIDLFDDIGLKNRFPFYEFPAGSEGIYEPHGAGHISPRRLVRAQSLLAERAGAALIRDVATSIRDEGGRAVVSTASGKTVAADKVLLAAGGFSIRESLLPWPVDLKVYARTVVFFEVEEEQARRLGGMPSLITKPENERDSIYLLPPIRYPDGRIYAKIGGDPDDLRLRSDAEIRAWFRGFGRESARDHLVRIMGELVPGLDARSITTAPCVTTFTPTGYPAIGYTASPRIAVMTGGCGAAAKSSDEIGRLGAELLLAGGIKDTTYETDFAPLFL
ncbi:FAD-binding oxidoreductase [Rhizobiaceae bacterium n13]|uniref:FAD-binding oxidoreductase n=1 Tax=Ferirhizobium litorale TaxID=2927786 RepID=A0AAE3QJ39_9HYPH|nr:FAD-binding oxidoreductase [Fererhizobium litorale]MDI7863776.1 FAD-binding oxidoreductase [Fererhizobium litorale]MDI7924124.1 FAD-binding oxidoreductase [Fererhizobium litorale]